MTIRHAVLVENPAIYMHALEACARFEIPFRSAALIVTTSYPRNSEMLKGMIANESWGEVHWPTLKQLGSTDALPRGLMRVKQVRENIAAVGVLAKRFERIETLVSGFYSHELSLHFASLVPFDRYVLVDDGNMTASTAAGRAAERAINFKRVLGVNSPAPYSGIAGALKLFVKRHIIGIKDRGVTKLTFYTSRSDVNADGSDLVVRHRYEHLWPEGRRVQRNRYVYFLGGPFLEQRILSVEGYAKVLAKLADAYRGRPIKYFPHRFEADDGIGFFKRAFPDAEVVRLGVPFEYFLARESELPATIGSFYSSALPNLRAMLKGATDINVVVIPPGVFASRSERCRVAQLYGHFRDLQDDTFRVMNLQDVTC